MIVIANSKKYGTGVVINPNGVMNDGKFEIIILKNLDLVVFGKIITGNMPLNQKILALFQRTRRPSEQVFLLVSKWMGSIMVPKLNSI
jgi:diacylglycerol kinase family enzyme